MLRAAHFQVDIVDTTLKARNPALDRVGALAGTTNVFLSQKVTLRQTPNGPMWAWVWDAMRPAVPGVQNASPEFEPFCRADEVDEAARRIAAVVRHREESVDE